MKSIPFNTYVSLSSAIMWYVSCYHNPLFLFSFNAETSFTFIRHCYLIIWVIFDGKRKSILPGKHETICLISFFDSCQTFFFYILWNVNHFSIRLKCISYNINCRNYDIFVQKEVRHFSHRSNNSTLKHIYLNNDWTNNDRSVY